jgi:hypothetical protein
MSYHMTSGRSRARDTDHSGGPSVLDESALCLESLGLLQHVRLVVDR